MNARGQNSMVLWVIVEAVLAIVFVTGLFVLVNRADAETGPEQSYAAKDLALTREAIETTTNMYYEFDSPAIRALLAEKRGFVYSQGVRAVVGSASEPVLSNGFFSSVFVTDLLSFVPMAVLPGRFLSGEDAARYRVSERLVAVPCPQPVMRPNKIGLVPANEASLAFTNAIAATSPLFVSSLADRKALIGNTLAIADLQKSVDLVVTVDVTTGKGVLVSGSQDGFLGCAVTNVLLDAGGTGAYVPQFDETPRITIKVGVDVATPAVADRVREVFS